MNRAIVLSILLVMSNAPAFGFELGGEFFLVDAKTIGAVQLGGQINESVDISTDFGFVFSDSDESRQGASGRFLGSLFGVHALFRQNVGRGLDARLGGGFDLWPLYGIHREEVMGGLVFLGEIRGDIVANMRFFLRSRFYVLHNDGLQPGIDRNGLEAAPLIWSSGLIWRL